MAYNNVERGRIEYCWICNRMLLPDEIALLYESPFVMFRPFRKKSLLWLIWRYLYRLAHKDEV